MGTRHLTVTKRGVNYANIVWKWNSGPKPTLTWPHVCNVWDEICTDDCAPMSVLGCWNARCCGQASQTFECSFALRTMPRKGGYWLQFYLMDGDDADWCMNRKSDLFICKDSLKGLFRWLDAQPILDVWLLHARLKTLGFSY